MRRVGTVEPGKVNTSATASLYVWQVVHKVVTWSRVGEVDHTALALQSRNRGLHLRPCGVSHYNSLDLRVTVAPAPGRNKKTVSTSHNLAADDALCMPSAPTLTRKFVLLSCCWSALPARPSRAAAHAHRPAKDPAWTLVLVAAASADDNLHRSRI